jgi:RimJ/RimL family protein N-acetyltransferase
VATQVVLRDGTEGLVWPVLPTDRAGLAEGYRHLDLQSRYHRFFTAAPRLSEEMLHHLVDEVDGVDHVAFVLVAFDDEGRDLPAGVARMIRYENDPTAADVAVTVLPEMRGRGAASALLEELVRHRPEGVERIVTQVAADNEPSLRMLERLGPATVTPVGEHANEVVVELPPEAAAQDQ